MRTLLAGCPYLVPSFDNKLLKASSPLFVYTCILLAKTIEVL